MDELVPVLVAFLLGLAVQPWLERRARALERWELDVLRFGDVFTRELTTAREAAWRAWLRWDVLYRGRDPRSVLGEPEFAAEEARRLDEARVPMESYLALMGVKLNWLAKRIGMLTPDADAFTIAWGLYYLGQPDGVNGWTEDNRDHLTQAWEREPADRKRVTTALEELAQQIAPPSRLRYRLRRRAWTARGRVVGLLKRGWLALPGTSERVKDPKAI